MAQVTIDRELLERVAQYTPNIDRQEDRARAISELRSVLDSAPRQPEGETISRERVQAEADAFFDWPTTDKSSVTTTSCLIFARCIAGMVAAERDATIAERDAEIERLRVKLLAIFSAEPGRHNIEWAKAMAATGNNEAYAKWREAFDQRDKLAGLLRDARELIDHGDFREGYCMCGGGVEVHSLGDGHAPVDAGEYYAGQVRERIDAALAEVEP